MTNFNALAQVLWDARRLGHVIPAFDELLTVPEGYDIQMRIAEISGDQRMGFKVGSTSQAAQERLGTDEPGAGVLLERYTFRDTSPQPVAVPVWPAHEVYVEAEFAFEMNALPTRPGGYSRDEVIAAIASFRPALEIVGSRFEGGLGHLGRALLTADGGVNVALVTGEDVSDWQDLDLSAQPVSLTINGEHRATGTGAEALGSPLNVLEWLARHLSGRGIDLRAGDVISTGTCTGLIAVAPGDTLHADFGELGTVSALLTEA